MLGPIQKESHEGFRYAVGFIDCYSCFGAVYPKKSKDDVTAKLQRFIIDVGGHGTLVSDGALEFKSKQFSDLCTSNSIKQEFSAPYTPEENGKTERHCDWHEAMHDVICRVPKAVLAFCSFNCHLPKELINPLSAWQKLL